jgi:hypothetical protein
MRKFIIINSNYFQNAQKASILRTTMRSRNVILKVVSSKRILVKITLVKCVRQ